MTPEPGSGHEGGNLLERLPKLVAKVVRRARAESLGGDAMHEHHEQEAQRLVVRALAAVGLPGGAAELRLLKSGDARKALVARLIRERTTAGNGWLAQRLALGHAAGVSRIADRVAMNPKLAKAYEKLTRMFQCAD